MLMTLYERPKIGGVRPGLTYQPFNQRVLFLDVTQTGTEAAAASYALLSYKCGRNPIALPPVEFLATRPFVFLIHDKKSSVILFMARIADPSVTR